MQQARNLALTLGERFEDIRFLVRDRGSNFTASFDAVFQAAGTRIVRSAVQTPRMNAICERLVGTLRRQLLDRVLTLGEGHLRAVLTEYQAHYNAARPSPGHRPARPRPQTRRWPPHRCRPRPRTDPPKTRPGRPDQRICARRLTSRRTAGHGADPIFERDSIQAAHCTDSYGHCPQNRLTCANQQAEPCAPKRIQQGKHTPRQGRRTTHWRRLSPAGCQNSCGAPELGFYPRRSCSSASYTSPCLACSRGLRCSPVATPRKTWRSWCYGTSSRYYGARSPVRSRIGPTVVSSLRWHDCCPDTCGPTGSPAFRAGRQANAPLHSRARAG